MRTIDIFLELDDSGRVTGTEVVADRDFDMVELDTTEADHSEWQALADRVKQLPKAG